jgi:hypothetical protein
MKTAKLFVRCTENSLEILRYLNEIIVQVNEMGMKIEIEKIDNADMTDDMVHSLKRAGLRALPALAISGKAKPYIGVREIKGLFEQNLAKLNNGKRVAIDGGGGDAPPTELDDYWAREMTAGMKKGPKGKVEFNDNDGPVGEGQDFERKMAEYRKKIPAHRQGGRAAEQEQEQDQSPPPRRRRQPEPEAEEEAPRRRTAAVQRDNIDRSATTGDDDTDRKMMAAWMENNNVDV